VIQGRQFSFAVHEFHIALLISHQPGMVLDS